MIDHSSNLNVQSGTRHTCTLRIHFGQSGSCLFPPTLGFTAQVEAPRSGRVRSKSIVAGRGFGPCWSTARPWSCSSSVFSGTTGDDGSQSAISITRRAWAVGDGERERAQARTRCSRNQSRFLNLNDFSYNKLIDGQIRLQEKRLTCMVNR